MNNDLDAARDAPANGTDVSRDTDGNEAGEPVATPCVNGAATPIDDPLAGLAERTTDDPGALFAPAVLARLRQLKAEDRPAFETMRAQLKTAGCRMSALDEAMDTTGDGDRGGSSQADILIGLASEADLFRSGDGKAFADIEVAGHRETWLIRTIGFKRWLARQYYNETGGAPSAEAANAAINLLEAKAHFDGPQREVFLRVGHHQERLYLDLGNDAWQAVEISPTGWRVTDRPTVRFQRPPGLQPLPVPVRGGSADALRSFLNVRSEGDFVLVVAWLLACLRDRGPYPVLVVSGEQGSAKSTFCALLRALIDPNTAPLRALPSGERDLFIAAGNGHVLAFDNVSALPDWLSDALCRLATGGAFAVRQLYSDHEEMLFKASRPIILNGIEDVVSRSDLADRALFLTLGAIPDEKRRPEADLWAAFEAERAGVLGILLDAVVTGLRRLPHTHLSHLPRMADFALWATACEPALWPDGTFATAYEGNRVGAVDDVIDADPVAAAVRELMLTRQQWTGTASELVRELATVDGDRSARSRSGQDYPRVLSGHLRRVATFLRKIGIDVAFERQGRKRTRVIHITAIPAPNAPEDVAPPGSVASASSAKAGNTMNGGPADEHLADDAVRTHDGASKASVRDEPAQAGAVTDADDADARSAAPSGPALSGPRTPEDGR